MPHFIRLRGPWQCLPTGRWVHTSTSHWHLSSNDLPPTGTVSMPGDWRSVLGPNFTGRVAYSRVFRCPEAVAAASQVWLEIATLAGQAKILLNGQQLGEITGGSAWKSTPTDAAAPANPAARLNITNSLQPRNLLEITVTSDPTAPTEQQSGHLGLVRLAIDEPGSETT